ncbi:MAG: hypothetical protein ACKV0T_04320, partial [Planctomycetales bacterium]
PAMAPLARTARRMGAFETFDGAFAGLVFLCGVQLCPVQCANKCSDSQSLRPRHPPFNHLALCIFHFSFFISHTTISTT